MVLATSGTVFSLVLLSAEASNSPQAFWNLWGWGIPCFGRLVGRLFGRGVGSEVFGIIDGSKVRSVCAGWEGGGGLWK